MHPALDHRHPLAMPHYHCQNPTHDHKYRNREGREENLDPAH
ncbi:MAG TPA: hypothetical protein VKB79_14480 [Bryobacteraceae bacterium]|nr:hypothetical protein [Bryobacteraceae bacterium]